jgi:hypothetical protein
VREVIDVARRVTGRDIPVVVGPRRAGDPPSLVASAARAQARLGWRATRSSLERIVSDAWAWHARGANGPKKIGESSEGRDVMRRLRREGANASDAPPRASAQSPRRS